MYKLTRQDGSVAVASDFKPVKRTALDGKVWWVIWDCVEQGYSSWYGLRGRYKRKKDCQGDINYCFERKDNSNE
jgi:hypothetical protein